VDFLYVAGLETPRDWEFFEPQDELSRLLGRRVDLVPKEYLHWVVRDRILAEARTVYVAA
jgi:predicted nucleotidyltransferase